MRRWRWRLYLGTALLGPMLCVSIGFAYLYDTSDRLITDRLSQAQQVVEPRIYGRPLVLRAGQALGREELVDRLNELGFAEAPPGSAPGTFGIEESAVTFTPREADPPPRTVQAVFEPLPHERSATRLARLDLIGEGPIDRVELGAPVISSLVTPERTKYRRTPLARIPRHVIQAVLAIEDRRFYSHPGVDVIRTAAAMLTNVQGDRPYLVGGSTLTQQLVKNFFLSPEKTLQRKVLEQFMAVLAERRLTKDEILELYLNEVYLGQTGSFAIHGVAEGARFFFGKDIANVDLAEAAMLAGVIQAPQAHSPVRHPERAIARRRLVLQAMAETGAITSEQAAAAAEAPLDVLAHPIDLEAPYFVDAVTEEIRRELPELSRSSSGLEVETTLDLHLQRLAQRAVEEGLDAIERQRPSTGPSTLQAALIALDPRSGDILAMVGGRSYARSQYNRAIRARRQPGSIFKPFVFLAAFEQSRAGALSLTPASIVEDVPTTFRFEGRSWRPSNYRGQYDGPITLRRALAFSRNVATVKVASRVGYQAVADLWGRVVADSAADPYPSIALGVTEASPLDIARAYTLFSNLGEIRTPRLVAAVRRGGEVRRFETPPPLRVAEPQATFLVTNMLRSVFDDGTGAAARAWGFRLDAAGKSGTTDDLRDAWFVGFTPELLTVVWVGHDDNRPLGLSGTQAALPIWTSFMRAALSGRPSVGFDPPVGIEFATIDPATGLLAAPGCPGRFREAFLSGTAPRRICPRHP